MSNVISLATRKPITTAPAKTRTRRKAAPAPAPAQRPFSRTDDLAPHLFEPGRERNSAISVALVLANFHVGTIMPRDPHKALQMTRRALAILEVECAELARAQKGGAA